jgi:hypothetical protein
VSIVVRALVSLVAVLSAAGQVVYLDALSGQVLGLTGTLSGEVRPALLALMTAHAVVSLATGALAVVMAFDRGPRREAARWLAVALGAWSYLMAYSGATLLLRPGAGPARALFEGHFLLVEAAGLAGLIRFTSLYPRPLLPEALRDSSFWPAVLVPVRRLTLWLLRPSTPWIAAASVSALLIGWTLWNDRPLGDAGLHPVADLVRFAVAGLVVLNVRRSWHHASAEGRNRLGWLLMGMAFLLGMLLLLIGGNVLMAVTGWPEPVVAWRPLLLDVGLLGFLASPAVGIRYEGKVQAVRAARRTLAVGAVTSLALFFAAGLEALLSGGMLARMDMGRGFGTAVALATVLSTHGDLLGFVERIIDQVLPSGADEAQPERFVPVTSPDPDSFH